MAAAHLKLTDSSRRIVQLLIDHSGRKLQTCRLINHLCVCMCVRACSSLLTLQIQNVSFSVKYKTHSDLLFPAVLSNAYFSFSSTFKYNKPGIAVNSENNFHEMYVRLIKTKEQTSHAHCSLCLNESLFFGFPFISFRYREIHMRKLETMKYCYHRGTISSTHVLSHKQ